jgi:hypothetical protein
MKLFKTSDKKREYDRLAYASSDKLKVLEERKKYYEANKAKIIARTIKWGLERKKNLRSIVLKEKLKPCTDCGKIYHYCIMDFDHLEGHTKKANISVLVNNSNTSVRVLQEELAKCEIVCSNCHRVRTFNRIYNKDLK